MKQHILMIMKNVQFCDRDYWGALPGIAVKEHFFLVKCDA